MATATAHLKTVQVAPLYGLIGVSKIGNIGLGASGRRSGTTPWWLISLRQMRGNGAIDEQGQRALAEGAMGLLGVGTFG